jgi:glyoxylase-like metal-dependent hydrolase (beta-lactamase superfamily II)
MMYLYLMVLGLGAAAQSLSGQAERKVTKLADGVYEIEHKDEGVGVQSGNTTVIIGDRQVFVVDAGFLPSVAREDIAQIRQWTDKPVCFVLTTHFHNDHNFANRAYMDAFPAATFIATVEAKHDMDRYGPTTELREKQANAEYQRMLDSGKTRNGTPLTAADKTEITEYLAKRAPVMAEIAKTRFQSATLAFDHDFSIDLGNREVQVKFLGRGNTAGDAVVYLPKERIVMAGDLVGYPLTYMFDGYPTEWIQTLDKLAQLDAAAIVPGHGPVLHDKTHIFLVRDFMKSAVDQMNDALGKSGHGKFSSLDEVRGKIDLTPFRQRFAGADKDLAARFDNEASALITLVYQEVSLR